jgi:hypothetical protein
VTASVPFGMEFCMVGLDRIGDRRVSELMISPGGWKRRCYGLPASFAAAALAGGAAATAVRPFGFRSMR